MIKLLLWRICCGFNLLFCLLKFVVVVSNKFVSRCRSHARSLISPAGLYSKLKFAEEASETIFKRHNTNSQLKRASCWLQISPSELCIKIPMLRRKFAKFPGKEHPV